MNFFCVAESKKLLKTAEDSVPLPHFITVGIIILVIGAVLLGLYFLCCKFLRKKKKGKKAEKKGLLGKGGGDVNFGQQPLGHEDDDDEVEEVEKEKEEVDEKAQFLGSLNYTVDYDFTSNQLTIGIIKATDLVGMDMSGTSDPYVKVQSISSMQDTHQSNNANECFSLRI